MKPAQLRISNDAVARTNWRQLYNFFDVLPAPVLELGEPGSSVITYCNGAFSVLLADHAQGIVGTPIQELAASDKDRRRLERDSLCTLSGRDISHPYAVNLKSRTGETVPIRMDWLQKMSIEGSDLGCLIFAQSLSTSPADHERSIRRVFYEIVEKSGEAIGIATDTGAHLYRNEAHKKLFGRENVPNSDFGVLDVLTDESIERVANEVRVAVEETGQWVGILESKTPEGLKPIWVRTHEINDPVSDRRIRFAQMHDHSEELELRRKLAMATVAAEEAQQAQQGLFFALSHDFRATLQAVSLYLEAAERKAKKQEIEIDELQKAREAVFSVQDYFKGILELLAKNASTIEPRIEYMRGQDLLEYLDRAYRPMAEEKGLTLTLVECNHVFPTDPSLMKRITGNLLANAIKFTEAGGVRVDCTKLDGGSAIRISDTGCGIDEGHLDQIFDQFFRVDTARHDGLGIGLSITKSLCDLLDHRISVISTPGKGSVFTVSIDPIE